MKEQYGGYTLPTEAMAGLIGALEGAVNDCMARHGVHDDMLSTTLRYVKLDASCFVGCVAHVTKVTKEIIKFYLRARMFFAGAMKNTQVKRAKEKSEDLMKQAKNVE